MHTLLVAGTTLAGIVIGGALDPVGQRLAELSRVEDERRRAEQAAHAAGDAGPRGTELPLPDEPATPARPGADTSADTSADATADTATVRHLVPSGPSTIRTVAAAVITGGLFAAAAAHFGADAVLAPFCVFFALLVAVSMTDLSYRLVPRRLVYAGTAVIVPLLVVTSAADHQWHSLIGSAIGGAVAFGLFFAVWWFVPRGMGYGDVRLAGCIGLTVGYLSLLHAYVAFLAGFVIGMVFGLALMAGSSAGRKTRIPFAPSLAIGAVFAVLWGGHVAQSLFHAGQ